MARRYLRRSKTHDRRTLRSQLAVVMALGGMTLLVSRLGAQAERPVAFLVRVPVPIVGNVDEAVRRQIRRQAASVTAAGERPTIVLEFWSSQDDQESPGSEFERSLSLARFLTSPELSAFRTVAYVPRSVSGHAVLPVLACEEIVMHPDATLGAAGEKEQSLSPMVAGFYADIVERRRTVPVAVALGMLDPDLEVKKVTTGKGTRYVLAKDLAALKEEVNVLEVDTVVRQGDLARLTGNEMRLEHGFASHLADDRRDLAAKIGVGIGGLEPDPSLGGEWHAIRVDLLGPVNKTSVDRVIRTVEEQLRGNTNLVCVWIDSPGGAPELSLKLAGFLASLDPARVRTIAYISEQALGDAALVAVGCDHVVAQKDAVIGGPGAHQPNAQQIADLRIPVRQICDDKSQHWSLPIALFDPDLEVFRYQLKGTQLAEYFCEEELLTTPNPDRWQKGEQITVANQPLKLSGEKAAEISVARFAVDNYEEFKQLYDLEDDPHLIAPSWADDFIDYLAQPHVAGMLLFFGGFALMVELSAPGLGAGAFVSALCFVLFFWSQFLHGTADWLEILLFLLGVVFIAIEIFVVPGFGLFGVGGAILIVASLILASQTFIIPQNDYQYEQLPRSLLTVMGAGGGIVFGLMILRKYIDQAPLLRRMMLRPPEGEELSELERRESLVDYSTFVGQVGLTTTQLVPSGKAVFGDRLVDVISKGPLIEKGAKVRVDEVIGNRVVVSLVE